ncbi:hypothetical protein MAHJHV63_53610 [Mycobacterium avium subsp. hominissuis]
MKVLADRATRDVDDLQTLLRHLGITTEAEVWAIVERSSPIPRYDRGPAAWSTTYSTSPGSLQPNQEADRRPDLTDRSGPLPRPGSPGHCGNTAAGARPSTTASKSPPGLWSLKTRNQLRVNL